MSGREEVGWGAVGRWFFVWLVFLWGFVGGGGKGWGGERGRGEVWEWSKKQESGEWGGGSRRGRNGEEEGEGIDSADSSQGWITASASSCGDRAA